MEVAVVLELRVQHIVADRVPICSFHLIPQLALSFDED